MRRKLHWILILALLLAMLPLSHAQEASTETPVDFVGTVEAINGTTITVNGVTVDVSAVSGLTLEVGTVVTLTGLLQADGSIVASVVAVTDESADDEVTLVGTVDNVGDGSVTVGGETVDISAASVNTDLTVGVVIAINATFSEGNWVGEEVEEADDEDEADVEAGTLLVIGVIQTTSESSVTVGSQEIDTSTAEETAPLLVGLKVKIKVKVKGDGGVFVAIKISAHVSGDEDDEFDGINIVIEGPVEAINANLIVIYGINIQLDPDDDLLDELVIGDLLHVEGHAETQGGVIIIIVIHVRIITIVNIQVNPGGGGDGMGMGDDD